MRATPGAQSAKDAGYLYTGSYAALGAGAGLVVGLLALGGDGVAVGLSMGAAVGAALGAARDARVSPHD